MTVPWTELSLVSQDFWYDERTGELHVRFRFAFRHGKKTHFYSCRLDELAKVVAEGQDTLTRERQDRLQRSQQ